MPDTTSDASPMETARLLTSLDRRVAHLWRITLTVQTVAFAAIAAVLFVSLDGPIRAIHAVPVVLVLGLIHAAVWPRFSYRAWGYRIRTDDVFVRRGVLWRAASVIPHSRLQHVDTERGPLERLLGLARVVIYTAGSAGAKTTIPGLAAADAEALRDRLGELGSGDDAV